MSSEKNPEKTSSVQEDVPQKPSAFEWVAASFKKTWKDKKEETEFKKKIDAFISGKRLPFTKRFSNFFRNPDQAQRYGRRAFGNELFSLGLRTVSPFAATSKKMLGSTFGLQHASNFIGNINDNLAWSSQINIYNRAVSALTKETNATMPEIEREMKSHILEKNIGTISEGVFMSVRSRFQKYSSYIGVAGSAIALASLNPTFLALGVPAYFVGQRLSRKRKEIQKAIFPHEFQARRAVWRQQDKAIRNADMHSVVGDNERQIAKLERAQKDLFEVSEQRRKRQIPLILESAVMTSVLTGVALGVGVASGMGLPALVGTYAATNAFLGSIQSWVMARYNQQEVVRDMMKNYNEIKHREAFDLQVGKEKLPENVDTIHIDHLKYCHRKREQFQTGERYETPILDFSSDFDFKPGINILGGVSGVGKSTLYKLLRHADDLSGGSISFGRIENVKFIGKKLTEMSLEDARRPISFSLPELRYVDGVSAVEMIKESNPILSNEKIKEIAEHFSLSLWEDAECKKEKFLSSMSSGEKKRVLCISALVSPKKILVLDEPTSGVDPKNADRILEEINSFSKDKTIIYTTHNPDEILKLNVSNIVKLEQDKTDDGRTLPTDVKIYPCRTQEEKQAYIDTYHSGETKTEEREQPQKKKRSIKDILLENDETRTSSEERPHENTFLKDLLNAEVIKRAAGLHRIIVSKSSAERANNVFTLSAIKSKARKDKEKYPRINKRLKDSSR